LPEKVNASVDKIACQSHVLIIERAADNARSNHDYKWLKFVIVSVIESDITSARRVFQTNYTSSVRAQIYAIQNTTSAK
jgi:hypothetical protein